MTNSSRSFITFGGQSVKFLMNTFTRTEQLDSKNDDDDTEEYR